MNRFFTFSGPGSLLAVALLGSCSTPSHTSWTEYLGGPDRNHYSELAQITPENVNQLEIAWTFSTPDSGQIQTSPIIVEDILYGITPGVEAFALNAATGEKLWSFGDTLKKWSHVSRGVTYWQEGEDRRVLIGIGHHLYALDARTGQPVTTFADQGKLDLRTGLPEIAQTKYVIATTPPALFENLIFLSVRVSEDTDAAPGDIRAFDVKTGTHVWTFHTIPYPGEENYDSFPEEAYKNTETGAVNNWTGMAVDTKRGILFVPTGSPSYDFYGANRPGNNLYANCLLALDARTGKRLWHFQTIRHDLWDRDLPAPPNLIQVKHQGKTIDAVAQVTKHGYVFVFDRVTGEPLFPIEEVPAPTTGLEGERIAATQPLPVKPRPFARQGHELHPGDISPFAPDRDSLLTVFQDIDKRRFAPPSREGTLIFPGFDGGAEWGGAAAAPGEGILYVNSNEMPWILTMVDTPQEKLLEHLSPGERLYTLNCASCHQPDRSGNVQSGYPSLTTIGDTKDRAYISQVISSGKGMMPGFTHLSAGEKQALLAFLLHEEKTEATGPSGSRKKQLPYKSTGYNKFLDSNGLPAIGPPWGTLNAIDLNTGEYLWSVPLGETGHKQADGQPTGTENYGGPLVTRNGLLFIGATKDETFRAFDRKTGKIVWETELPASAFATPATYMVNGRQFIVIACGGTKLGRKKGNQYLAFALPEKK